MNNPFEQITVEKIEILATRNAGKLREFNHAFAPHGIGFRSLDEIDNAPEVEETGATFEENALIKARAIAAFTGLPVIADDSGIEIDAMPGELGIRSARWAGDRSYTEANAEILLRLHNITGNGRAARYVAAVAHVDPSTGEEVVVKATCEGSIHDHAVGSGGFGYDPIFYVPEHKCAMAELPLDTKNKISHRAKAIALLLGRLFPSNQK
jgi:XTP/dITP diphosphohydrolase